MAHYYNYYNNKYNPQDQVPKENIKEPPKNLSPKENNDFPLPAFGKDNICYCKAMEFATRCGKLCIRMYQEKML